MSDQNSLSPFTYWEREEQDQATKLALQFGEHLVSFHAEKIKQQPEYVDSWIRRGPRIAFCNLNRKMERLEYLARNRDYDLFATIADDSGMDCVKDILVYIMLHVERSGTQKMGSYAQTIIERSGDIGKKYGPAWTLTEGLGAYADVSRKMDSLQQFAKDHGFNLLGNLTEDNPKAWERLNDLSGYLFLAVGCYLARQLPAAAEPPQGL